MMKALCSFMFFGHTKCKDQIHNLTQSNIGFINHIQELKAINNYQTHELEQKLNQIEAQLDLCRAEVEVLEKENRSLKHEIDTRNKHFGKGMKPKRTTHAASDGNTVEIVDYSK